MTKVVIHNHLPARTLDLGRDAEYGNPETMKASALYDKVDLIGGRAFMAGSAARPVSRKVEKVKALFSNNKPQFIKEAQELIRWANSSNDPIPKSW